MTLSYDDSVEESPCFGWIDSLVMRLDDDRFAQKFMPRKTGSKWSTSNRKRYHELEAKGLLASSGRAWTPTDRNGDAPNPSIDVLPAYISAVLKTDPEAWKHYEQLAPSYRREFIGWIDSAKRQKTRVRRL